MAIALLFPEAAMAEFDLPLALLDRLLASRIVPLQAKIRAVDSWRDELKEARSIDPRARELDERLAMACAFLKKQRLKLAAARVFDWLNALLRQCLRGRNAGNNRFSELQSASHIVRDGHVEPI
jgi:hypothetical protein